MKLDKVYKATTTRDAFAHASAVGICTAVLFLFVALTYSRLVLPRYTTNYTEKDVQQVVNLIITVIATLIGVLCSHCRRLTNEAETKTELRDQRLTIPRLHVHFEAASGSKVAMGIPVARNKEVWRLVTFYFLAMFIFAFIHSVLSVIFVIDAVISDKGELVPLAIPLSIDVPYKFDGKVVDTCANIDDPTCTYDLALHSVTSQLMTYQPYTIAGVTFEPPNGTMGLPFHAMKHFQDEVRSNKFDDARRRYCLPVLDPDIIKCEEVWINASTCASEDNFVKFKTLNISHWDNENQTQVNMLGGLYKISSPYPNPITHYGATKYRIDSQGKGIMIIQQFVPAPFTTLIGAANPWGNRGYATMLHRLLNHGKDPDLTDIPTGSTYDFAARCRLTSIMDQDNLASSWRQVDFTLNSGVLRANVTDERCPNARSVNGQEWSGFTDLTFALDGAGALMSSDDGYSMFFNEHPVAGQGTNIFTNMSRFEAVVNQVYHLVQTAWTESIYAMGVPAGQIPGVKEHPIMMTSYPHLFVIRISWTPTTYIGLVLALLMALNSWVLAARWFRAVHHFGFEAETWNLLRPVELMAYSLAASQDLAHSLSSKERRRMEMNGTTKIVLREHPLTLMPGGIPQRVGSEAYSHTSVGEYEKKTADGLGPGVSVRERQADVESGSSSPDASVFPDQGDAGRRANAN